MFSLDSAPRSRKLLWLDEGWHQRAKQTHTRTHTTSSMSSSSRAELLSFLVPQSQLFKSISSLGWSAWTCVCECTWALSCGVLDSQPKESARYTSSGRYSKAPYWNLNFYILTHKHTKLIFYVCFMCQMPRGDLAPWPMFIYQRGSPLTKLELPGAHKGKRGVRK